ncbi:GldM family protein [Aureispira anguillae]|uniref:Gliding motility-associated protein GldM C-terminal domain-containing protein n=1 Tax=Aureispira anguillae TaxID=2864201 RepID=A0A915YIU8_9BACT|nr:GldM family protein [Aureispira anguillae]BDS13898.1 hypothetical protein AsAng_0046610 [Aureispira anguillae]
MNTLKTIGGSLFLILLLASNFGMIVERFLLVGTDRMQFNIGGTILEMSESDFSNGTVAVAADKMNVFYVGVDNPITVAASGIPNDQLELLPEEGITINKRTTEGQYVVVCSKLGKARIRVKDKKTGAIKAVEFRIKRLPDPILRLGGKSDGTMKSGMFRAQPGLTTKADNMDMDISCQLQSYTLFYVCKRCDPIELKGEGALFRGMIRNVIDRAKPGDQYIFTNVKARCPGDKAGRRLSGLTFTIR